MFSPRIRKACAVAVAIAAAGSLSACSSSARNAIADSNPPTLPTSAPTTQLATTTTPPSTVPPTTIAPTTTAATTTTVPAPTTTAAPATTLPRNIEPVAALTSGLQAVGKSSGEATALIQTRLIQLGFWVSEADGDYGLETQQAVMAFQKYLGLEASGRVNDETAGWLTIMTEEGHGLSDTGTLVEVDKTRQLVFIVVDGKTQWIFNTSTGNGKEYEEVDKNTPGETIKGVALTPDGLWDVTRERPEGWWEGDLGKIYRPKYFRGGIALHGSNNIPNYPASHGCVRLSVPAMDFIWDSGLVPVGTTVWVHGG